ncbi:MAG: glycogen synthase GlgA, partial [Myxococcales bacterium]|nr:glycogen synthase GlgA [Myxococcales bacterium]
KIALIASEAVPWCKSGGLADVVGALPRALQEAANAAGESVEVALFLPMYRQVRQFIARHGHQVTDTGIALRAPMGGGGEPFRLLHAYGRDGESVYFIDAPHRYDRDGLYDDADHRAFDDNGERFALLCRAALEVMPRVMGGPPDILHVHDWQASLAPVYLKTRYRHAYPKTRSVLTIHNLAYQGVLPGSMRGALDIDASFLQPDRGEYYGNLNLLKGGMAYADAVTTVSPTYAREIRTPHYGCNLDGFVRAHVPVYGILNGIDTDAWNPATDPLLPARYDADHLEGKAVCRELLLEAAGLRPAPGEALLGVVSRFAGQKGIDLIAELVPHLHHLGARLVVLGDGDPELEDRFRWLGWVFSHHITVRIGFDPALSHRLIAGCDALLMPSRFEPCGLTQLYAMRYGTVPIVHAVGGLRDTVVDPGDAGLAAGEGTGFRFEHPTPEGLGWALARAVRMYRERPAGWRAIMQAGMRQDFSWARSAATYLELYRRLGG